MSSRLNRDYVDYVSVKSKSFNLLTAFKAEAESLGWEYNDRFSELFGRREDQQNECLYFSFESIAKGGSPMFALSNTTMPSYVLPLEWDEAIQGIKEMLKYKKPKVQLNNEYTATLNFDKKTVEVGGQSISFDKVLELAEIITA